MTSLRSAKLLTSHIADAVLTVVTIGLLAGCGAGSDATAPTPAPRPVAGPPAAIDLTANGPTVGPIGATLRSPFQAKVTDSAGRAVSGVSVTFSIDSGTVLTPSVTTDSSGVAVTRVRLPMTRGAATLTATIAGKQATVTLNSTAITFASISLAFMSTCGVAVGGYGYCWGSSLGAFKVANDSINVPTPMLGDYVFQSISVSANFGCGIVADSTAVCWGVTSQSARVAPMPVPAALKFRAIAAGDRESCGLTIPGQVYCWGWDGSGQAGGSAAPMSTPTQIDVPGTIVSLQSDANRTCALITTGQAYCWGVNISGSGTDAGKTFFCGVIAVAGCNTAPLAVTSPVNFSALATASGSSCGLDPTGTVYCWGANELGELGTGDTVSSATPRQVLAPHPFTQIAGGGSGFCGLTSGGDVYCWGAFMAALNIPFGTCPAGGSDCVARPTLVDAQGLHFSAISARDGELCGFATGIVYCWGYNWTGKLGTARTGNVWSDPEPVVNQATNQP